MPIKLVKENDNLTLLKNIMKGDKGDPGESAYQIALKNGFEGTEEEWLASLEGEQGESGIYVGTKAPEDDSLIWIDPEGEPDTNFATRAYVDEAIAANVPEVNLSDYYTKTEVDNLIPEVPTKVSELENDAGYLTEHQDLSSYALKTEIPDVSAYQTEAQVQALIDSAVASITDGEAVSY